MMTDVQSNYVACWLDWDADQVVVLERDLQTGERFERRWPAPYYFYVPDAGGEHTTIFGGKVKRLTFDSRDEWEAGKRSNSTRFESDIRPDARVLMDNYYGRPAPQLSYAFFDIEVDYKQALGFSGPANPYAPINAVTVYQSWEDRFLTFAVAPKGWQGDLPTEKQMREEFGFDVVPNIVICEDEIDLLARFIESIQEADVISGWNSEFFDVPYICERIIRVLGQKHLALLEHEGARAPRKDSVDRFGSSEIVYRFNARVHLDYLRLFQKFTFEGRTSYSLANIAYEELDVPKLDYDGTLEQLYNRDFKHFLMYNIRDVEILKLLDEKYKFIALANQMAHENTVTLESVMGTVKYVETGVANHAHHVLKLVVHDKNIQDHDMVEGAIVVNPKIGIHEWIGSVDINSLYPNVIRSINISPEKIVGQFPETEDAWTEIRAKSDRRLTFELESTRDEIVMTAKEWHRELATRGWAISAYGTVFDQSRGKGVVPDMLGFWYSERKRLQAEKKKWAKLAKELPPGPEKEEAKQKEEHFDLLQLTKKISMNSLYGALLNVAFRFGDQRMGASVTATGRQITTHMIQEMGYVLTGERHPLIKKHVPTLKVAGNGYGYTDTLRLTLEELDKLPDIPGIGSAAIYYTHSPAIIYGDTDSCYYKTFASSKEEAVAVADEAAAAVNATFPAFMREAFNCQPGFDDLIKAGREIVGRRGLFQAKKKYMVKIVDLEGVAVDKLKTMGSEIKKADTPKIIQEFLKKTVDMLLDGKTYDEVAEFVNTQRLEIMKRGAGTETLFNIGIAKQVNDLDKYAAEYRNPGTLRSAAGGKLAIPGHVRAALNYNSLIEMFDKGSKPIRPGDKVLLYYVKPNTFKYESVALPAELIKFPQWFLQNFEINVKLTEQKMFDSKLKGIFEALGREIPTPQSVFTNSVIQF